MPETCVGFAACKDNQIVPPFRPGKFGVVRHAAAVNSDLVQSGGLHIDALMNMSRLEVVK